MDLGASGSSSWLGSLRGFADGVIGSVQDRVELLSIELREEKHRLVQILIWTSAALFAATLAIWFASCAVVVAFWNTAARLPIVAGFAVAYGVAAIVMGVRVNRLLAAQPRPFAASIDELRTDRECIRPKS